MNPFELTGFATGVIGVWLTIRRHVWCFPVGLINVAISLYLFYTQQLYADSLQQLVYIPLLIFGWREWHLGKTEQSIQPERLHEGSHNISALTLLLLFIGGGSLLGFLLHQYTDASFPWPDSFATCGAFIAQYLVARKKIENWAIWILVNLAYIFIYLQKELYLYAALFAGYLVLAIYGYLDWKKRLTPTPHG